MRSLIYLRRVIRPLADDEKVKITTDLLKSATSSFDYFLLVVLSCSIATLGLITDSPAVIIGAMLVAPLMAPIIGIGLASITGDISVARKSALALLFGTGLAVLLSSLMMLINLRLPFIAFHEIPAEVMARTHPTPIDFAIAMAGGLAAAYAMTRPNISAALPGVAIATALMPPLCTVGIGIALGSAEIAGGAMLLFITNALTIAFASALVFLLRGFTPDTHSINHHIPQTILISAIILVILLVPLSYYSMKFVQQANANREINEVVARQVLGVNAELIELDTQNSPEGLKLVITVRTTAPLNYEQVVSLQKGIVDDLGLPISLKVNQILAERLDPLIPPTATPSFTPSPTNTPGPSPTITSSPMPPTATPTATVTVTMTPTPTNTQTNTPTPALAQAHSNTLPLMQLYQSPGGPVIGQIRQGQPLIVFSNIEIANGLIWIEVMDHEGRIGWIPELYLRLVTQTPTITP